MTRKCKKRGMKGMQHSRYMPPNRSAIAGHQIRQLLRVIRTRLSVKQPSRSSECSAFTSGARWCQHIRVHDTCCMRGSLAKIVELREQLECSAAMDAVSRGMHGGGHK